jgi:hypothetical protein
MKHLDIYLVMLVIVLACWLIRMASACANLSKTNKRLELELAKQRETLVIGVARRKSMLHDLDRVLGEYR